MTLAPIEARQGHDLLGMVRSTKAGSAPKSMTVHQARLAA